MSNSGGLLTSPSPLDGGSPTLAPEDEGRLFNSPLRSFVSPYVPHLDVEQTDDSPLPLLAVNTIGCCRGELYLTDEEATILNQYLKALGPDHEVWQFSLTDEMGGPYRLGRSKSGKLTSARDGVTSCGPKPQCSTALARAESENRRNSEDVGIPQSDSDIQLLSNPAAAKKLPDWAWRFHRVLMTIGAQESCRHLIPLPTSTSLPPDSYRRYLDLIHPISPISLQTVVTKLEQNSYSSALEVFNDVYCIWIASFRSEQPGSDLWMKTHECALSFAALIANEPLRDNFREVSAAGTTAMEAIVKEIVGQRSGGSARGRTSNGGRVLQRAHTSVTTTKKTQPRGGGKAAVAAGGRPITDTEKADFQTLLQRLHVDQHFALYNEFKNSAIWRNIDGGEVELNDADTPPAVFRKMIMWVRRKVTTPTTSGGPKSATRRKTSPGELPTSAARKKTQKQPAAAAAAAVTPVAAAAAAPPSPFPGAAGAVAPRTPMPLTPLTLTDYRADDLRRVSQSVGAGGLSSSSSDDSSSSSSSSSSESDEAPMS